MHESTNLVIIIGHHWQESTTTTTTNHSLYWNYHCNCILWDFVRYNRAACAGHPLSSALYIAHVIHDNNYKISCTTCTIHRTPGSGDPAFEQWNCKRTFTQCLSSELLMTGKLTISLKCRGQCPVRGLLSRHVTLSSQSDQYKLFRVLGRFGENPGKKGVDQ